MDSHKLAKFDFRDYCKQDTDSIFNKPYAELNKNGIFLVSEYYSSKYKMPKLININNVEELIEKIKSDEFLKIRNTSEDVRIPFQIIGKTHSTPVAYIKQDGKEYLLFFDSLADGIYLAKNAAESFPDITVYSSIKTRQRDNYSCHSEAQIFLRELIGKDQNGNYLIPDILIKLNKNKLSNDAEANYPSNLFKTKLFDSLLMTIQVPTFKEAHEQEYKSNAVIHKHKNQPETIEDFSRRYPPEEVVRFSEDKKPKPTASSYLREKGLKFIQIIEIQFYVNQMQKLLGDNFNQKIKDDFISDAKKILKQDGRISFLTEQQKTQQSSKLYDLAEKILNENLSKLIKIKNEIKLEPETSNKKNI